MINTLFYHQCTYSWELNIPVKTKRKIVSIVPKIYFHVNTYSQLNACLHQRIQIIFRPFYLNTYLCFAWFFWSSVDWVSSQKRLTAGLYWPWLSGILSFHCHRNKTSILKLCVYLFLAITFKCFFFSFPQKPQTQE